MLGQAITRKLLERGLDVYATSRTSCEMVAEDHEYLGDICEEGFIEAIAARIYPDVIVHTAAFVNLNFCEENKELTQQLHVNVPAKLATTFSEARFIYISTDSVFNGVDGLYNEEDKPAPLNNYAMTKYHGEQEVEAHSKHPLILRLNIYGSKNKTANSLAEWALRELKNSREINGFSDVFFNPLYIYQVADIIYDFITIHKNEEGIFHLGSEEKVSKYAFLQQLAKTFGLDDSLVKEGLMSDMKSVLARPFNTTLDTGKYENLAGRKYLLKQGLEDFKNNFETLNHSV